MRYLALVLALALCPLAARAAGPEPDVRLPDTVVTPSRHEGEVFESPFRVEVVEGEDLSGVEAPRSLPDALGTLTGVMPQKTSYGQGSPYLRGLTGFRTLLMVDGIRLNNSVFRDGPNQYLSTVDALSLDRLEALGGPASVLYGSDALGGAVNFIPLLPVAEHGAYPFGGRIYQRFASAEDSSVTRFQGQGGLAPDFGFLIGIDRKTFRDLRDGDGDLPCTGYDEWAADGRLVYDPTPDLRLSVLFQRVSQDDVPRTHRTVHAVPFHGTTVGSDRAHEFDQTRSLLALRAEALQPGAWADDLRATLSWQRQRETRYRRRGDGRHDRQGFTVDTLGLDVTAGRQTAIGRLTYGLDGWYDLVDSFAVNSAADGSVTSRAIQGPVGDEADYLLLGAFVQDEADLGGGFTATAGLRGTFARADADEVLDPVTGEQDSISDHFSSAVGSARLAWRAAEEASLYAGASQGFRAPNLSDLTRLDVARSNELEVPNTDLDPERVLSFEAGAKVDLGPFRGDVSVFHTELSDFIQRVPTDEVVDGDTVVEKDNSGDGAIRGIEARGEVDLADALTAFAAGAYYYGKIGTYDTASGRKGRDWTDRLPPLAGRAGLRFEPLPGLSFTAQSRFAARADRLSPGDRADTERIPPDGTPGYAVFDLSAAWAPTPWLSLALALENVADRTWRVHGSGVNEPGRNLVLCLTARF